jgi:hypothetical protein
MVIYVRHFNVSQGPLTVLPSHYFYTITMCSKKKYHNACQLPTENQYALKNY